MARRSEMALNRKAIRERWPVPAGSREKVVYEMRDVLNDPAASVRAKVLAARVLVDIDRLNMEQEKRDLAIPDRVDMTSGGKPLEPATVTITAEDVKAVRQLLGEMADGDVHRNGGQEPLGSYAP